MLQADLPENLRNAKSLAVSLRRDGHLREARQLTMQTYERYLDRFGAEAADTLACALNLAADHSASGDKEAARDLATTVYEGTSGCSATSTRSPWPARTTSGSTCAAAGTSRRRSGAARTPSGPSARCSAPTTRSP